MSFEITSFVNFGSDMEHLNENLRRKRAMEERTKRFAIGVFLCLNELPHSSATRVISYQLGKSGPSIGANYREANRAESKEDFTHKIGIVLKESSETVYWLEVLLGIYPQSERVVDLLAEANEFVRIFQSTRSKMLAKLAEEKAKKEAEKSKNEKIQS